MRFITKEWRDRINNWIHVLTEDFYEPLGEIKWEMFRTTDHLTPDQARKQAFEPVEPGFTWGYSWEYGWFRGEVTLPECVKGERIVMDLHPDGESTLFVNDQTFGTFRRKGLGPSWVYFVDNVLTRKAEGGDHFDILMETYAGHPRRDDGLGYGGPVLSEEYVRDLELDREGKRCTLGKCTYGIFNEAAYQLYLDVKVLQDVYKQLDGTSKRALNIGKGLKKFTQIVDFEQPKEQRIASYLEAREMLRPLLEAHNGSSMQQCYAMGQSHLDLAWLWPFEETHRKTARTFASQIRLMEEYPEFMYLQSQPAAYEMCEEHYPDLFAKISDAVKRGQWIPEGGMWCEPDLNITGGESLIRQFVHGKRYFMDKFGVDNKILWILDTFGYPGCIPQIMKGCGVDYFVSQKIFWEPEAITWDEFPYHYFYWEGIDGTKVLSELCFVLGIESGSINKSWKDCAQPDMDALLVPFGYSDGGGGPSRDDIESARRLKDLEGTTKLEFKNTVDYFLDMEENSKPENSYFGELYFCAHRGTFTTQADIKKYNRKAEIALREMEIWSSLAMANGAAYRAEKADRLWKTVLLNQFHDVLPGSSIERVNRDAVRDLKAVIADSEVLCEDAKAVLVQEQTENGITIFNSLSFPRTELVVLPDAFADGAVTMDGTEIAVQKTNEGVKAVVSLPSCGAVSLRPAAATKPDVPSAAAYACEDGFCMENSKVVIKINNMGEITSYVRKDSGREFVGANQTLNHFRLYKDVPRYCDAWDLDHYYKEEELPGAENIEVSVAGDGLEALVKVTGVISHSIYTQYIRLAADSDVVLFDTEVDWKEMHRVLKVDFTSNVFCQNAINEIQYGYIERPTHRSRPHDQDRYEVCNHRYSALCDGSHGVAVLNDCKYGISMEGTALQLTLLRAAIHPEFRADNQVHHFTYAFTGWNGSFMDCDIVKQAYSLNVKPQFACGATEAFSALSIDKENIFLEAMKPAEDKSGDIVLRLYEAKKAPVTAQISCALAEGKKAYVCDMLENIQEEVPVENGVITLPFRPFEIKTIRLV